MILIALLSLIVMIFLPDDDATAISQPGNSNISSGFIWSKLDLFQQGFPFHLEIVSSKLMNKNPWDECNSCC